MQKQHFLTVEKLLDRLGERSVTDGGDEYDSTVIV
jgi:hypothetical protein